MLQVRTDLDDRATVLSIDGIGAFDLVSRESMLRGLLRVEGGGANSMLLHPAASGKTNTASSTTSFIGKVENKLGQHPPLEAVQSQLLEGETLCTSLDDLYAVCSPDRAVPIFDLIQRELWTYSSIEVHLGKTQIWNRGGFEPFGCHLLTAAARRVDPAAVVWRGDPTLTADQPGMKLLGTTLGHREFVDAQLRHITTQHQIFFDRIPHVTDLQCALLSASRPNSVLRVLHPDATREFAAHHEEGVRRCLSRLLGVALPDAGRNQATIPLNFGGLGLRSAI